jgi:hypothetical protein
MKMLYINNQGKFENIIWEGKIRQETENQIL